MNQVFAGLFFCVCQVLSYVARVSIKSHLLLLDRGTKVKWLGQSLAKQEIPGSIPALTCFLSSGLVGMENMEGLLI